MKILFLHGWTSVPGGRKPTYLKDHGHTILNPVLPDEDFEEAVRIAQAEYDQHQPDVVVGSSRGGAVAMNIESGDTPLVLLCPAWKNWGAATTVKPQVTILHSRADDVIPFEDSEELLRNSGLPAFTLMETGSDHRLADPKSLKRMLNVCENDVFTKMVHSQVVPWIHGATVPFFHLRKNPRTNQHKDGFIDKDRTGVLLRIGASCFVVTAAHNIPDMIRDDIYLFMSWDDDEMCPIPITTDQIAVSDEATLDVAVIKLLDETAAKLLRRHTPISLADVSRNCQSSDGQFLIVGYPRAGTHFSEQKWNDPEPHEIETESLKFRCKRLRDGWKHDKLKYSPHMHIVVGMSQIAMSSTSGQVEVLPDHSGIQGISGCGIWLIADRSTRKRLVEFGVEDCKLVAIEHSYDENSGRVAGTWINVALEFLAVNFPETRAAMSLVYPH